MPAAATATQANSHAAPTTVDAHAIANDHGTRAVPQRAKLITISLSIQGIRIVRMRGRRWAIRLFRCLGLLKVRWGRGISECAWGVVLMMVERLSWGEVVIETFGFEVLER